MMRKKMLAVALSVLLAGTAGCSALQKEPVANNEPIPYDVSSLVMPKKKFFGVAVDDVTKDPQSISKFEKDADRKPNIVAYYVNFNDLLDVKRLKEIWSVGAI